MTAQRGDARPTQDQLREMWESAVQVDQLANTQSDAQAESKLGKGLMISDAQNKTSNDCRSTDHRGNHG